MEMKPTEKQSADIHNQNLQKLREVFPQFVKDGEVDFDSLKAFFQEEGMLAESDEKYGLGWAGKTNAFKAIRETSKGTLRPQKEESKNWEETENLFIEGDNLEVLKLLQKQYREQIKMIYIDPPYNTGKDFVYKDNFTEGVNDYYERTGQSSEGIKLTTNLESNGRYHSDWLTMMYPRLFLARNLLREDGVIFISIDDNEVANLRLVMDEIFGEENFVAQLVWSGGRKNDSKLISISHEYVLVYLRRFDIFHEAGIIWRQRKEGIEEIYDQYNILLNQYGDDIEGIEKELKIWFTKLPDKAPARKHKHYSYVDEKGVYFPDNISWPGGGGPRYEVLHPITKKPVKVPSRGWMFGNPKKMAEAVQDNRVRFGKDEASVPTIKAYLSERETQVPYSVFYQDGRASTKRLREMMEGDYFDHPKDENILKEFLEFGSTDECVILDFFAGSGTTAHAVMQLNAEDGGNRKWISVQIPEVVDEKSEAAKAGYEHIAQISRERIRRAGEKIKEEFSDALEKRENALDIGFKAYALSASNYRQWQDVTEENEEEVKNQTKLLLQKPLADGATEEGVVYEVLLKEGFDLNSKVTQEKAGNLNIWRIKDADRQIIITFATEVNKDQVDALDLKESDIFVCLDTALNDTTKVNVTRNYNVRVI